MVVVVPPAHAGDAEGQLDQRRGAVDVDGRVVRAARVVGAPAHPAPKDLVHRQTRRAVAEPILLLENKNKQTKRFIQKVVIIIIFLFPGRYIGKGWHNPRVSP